MILNTSLVTPGYTPEALREKALIWTAWIRWAGSTPTPEEIASSTALQYLFTPWSGLEDRFIHFTAAGNKNSASATTTARDVSILNYAALGEMTFQGQNVPNMFNIYVVENRVSTNQDPNGPGPSIHPGQWHTCGVTPTGQAYCWGDGSGGQLGDGSMEFRQPDPVPVSGGISFTTMSGGHEHTCGLTEGDSAYCWGRGGFGATGIGSTHDVTTPTSVAGGLTFDTISAGWYHTCALTPTGHAYCWGDPDNGVIGLEREPVLVSGLTFDQISAGSFHACALTPGDSGYCWGANWLGQLGNGTELPSATPVRVLR